MTTHDLDLRELPPRVRHELIFSRLDELATGETLRLINDHDPVPLRYQLDATRPGHFRWAKVEDGPDRWQVEITSRVRLVDARPTLAAGGEPFGMIMDAVAELGEDDILVVDAPFEPVPLQGVLAEQGFGHVSERLSGGDWRTTFVRSGN